MLDMKVLFTGSPILSEMVMISTWSTEEMQLAIKLIRMMEELNG